MDFCDLDTPWGNVGRARNVLDFVSMALSWSTLQHTQMDISDDQRDGLMCILLTCAETLQKAEEEAKKERNKTGCTLPVKTS